MKRTPEDARYRPIPGDRFVYHARSNSYEEIAEVGGGRVLARLHAPPHPTRDIWTALGVWSSGAGVWVPA